ncbi:MAG TPA: DUF4142 domain-containing protein [Methylobacterium sp.]|nr:DUF4142 domain-containing protein [Methylobacterium sp.]
MRHTLLCAALGLTLAASALPASAQQLLAGPDGLVPVNDTPAFRAEALRGDAYSIEASRVALERSRNPKVWALANRTIEDRQATTDALLPPGSSLTAGGTVVADGSRGTAFDTPLGFITAPLAIPGAIVGGIVGGNAVVDSRPGEPGKRVALDAKRQETLTRLQAERGGRSFDKLYTGQQAVSNLETVALYRDYARTGRSAVARQFANQALPMMQDEAEQAARLHTGGWDEGEAGF